MSARLHPHKETTLGDLISYPVCCERSCQTEILGVMFQRFMFGNKMIRSCNRFDLMFWERVVLLKEVGSYAQKYRER